MKKLFYLTLSFAFPAAQATCTDGKTYPVHFTFDDGPHQVLTSKVLDVLKKEKVPATFFVLGNHFKGGRDHPSNKIKYALMDRMKNEGHKIGSHTYEHIHHPTYHRDTIVSNIMKVNPLLKDYLSPILRLPYGAGYFRSSNASVQAKNDMVMNAVKNAGFKHVAWDIDTNDWNARKRRALLPRMLRDICRQKGGIVLFHDVQKFTADNLRNWIRAVKTEAHTFVGLEHFVPEANDPLPPEALER